MMNSNPSFRQRSLVCALLAAVTLFTYWPVFHQGFVGLDNADYVTANATVRGGLSWAGLKWAFEPGHAANWHPLTWLSHMLDVQLFGLNAGGHHFTNLLLHTASTLLLFLLLEAMTGAVWRAAMVAALFALHPLHVESVAWIAERKDVLSGLFFMLTLWAYARYAAGSKGQIRKSQVWYGLALAAFACGLMSKPMLVTLPFVLLLLDVWPLGRMPVPGVSGAGSPAADGKPGVADFWPLLREKIPFLLMCPVSCYLTFISQSQGRAVISVGSLPLAGRMENVIVSYVKYVGKLFCPVRLGVFYPHPSLDYMVSSRWPGWEITAAGLLLVLVSVIVGRRLGRQPWLFTGWFWYVGTLVPVIGLVQVGSQGMADRYMYLPSIGLFIGGVWLVADGGQGRRFGRPLLTLTGVALLLSCGLLTRNQLSYWRDEQSLYSHALAVEPHNPEVEYCLAQALFRAGQYDQAMVHLRQTLADVPDSTEPRYDLGLTLEKMGRETEAEAEFRRILEILPGHQNAGDALVRLLLKRGEKMMASGRTNEARTAFAEALKTQPDLADKKIRAGMGSAKQGQVDAAVESLTVAGWLSPTNAGPSLYLGMLRAQQGDFDGAVSQFSRSLQLDPQEPAALNGLAWIRATAPAAQFRDGAEAVRFAEQACRLTQFKQPYFLSTLATAYAEAGKFPEAISTAGQARDLAEQSGQQELAEQDDRLLGFFHAGKAYHQPAKSATPAPAE
jgi:protein O-mannosyl-transferase